MAEDMGIPTTSWRVTSQQEQVGRDGNSGAYVPGVLIRFTTDKGDTASVWVPHSHYTEPQVREAIQAKVATMHNIGKLSGKVG